MCVCGVAGVERTPQRRIEFLRPEMPPTHTRRRSDTGDFRSAGTQEIHNTHWYRKYADGADTHVDISRFHEGHGHAFTLTAQDYTVTYREVHAFEH